MVPYRVRQKPSRAGIMRSPLLVEPEREQAKQGVRRFYRNGQRPVAVMGGEEAVSLHKVARAGRKLLDHGWQPEHPDYGRQCGGP